MNIKKLMIGAAASAVMLGSMIVPAFAASTDLGSNWRVFNGMPATAKFWDINPVKPASDGSVQFPIQQFDTPTTGSFVIYLLNNYNVDMTRKTIRADVSWTSTGTSFVTRGLATDGAYVRLEFQDVTAGPYDSNDYWWSTGTTNTNLAIDLNGGGTSGTLTASLTDCNLWSNQSGKSACDTTPNWLEWQGDIVALSPADGFANAVKNVKQVGLSFGRASAYASGVAIVGGTGTFNMTGFTIAP